MTMMNRSRTGVRKLKELALLGFPELDPKELELLVEALREKRLSRNGENEKPVQIPAPQNALVSPCSKLLQRSCKVCGQVFSCVGIVLYV